MVSETLDLPLPYGNVPVYNFKLWLVSFVELKVKQKPIVGIRSCKPAVLR